jgi:hypothetical protein
VTSIRNYNTAHNKNTTLLRVHENDNDRYQSEIEAQHASTGIQKREPLGTSRMVIPRKRKQIRINDNDNDNISNSSKSYSNGKGNGNGTSNSYSSVCFKKN